MKTLYVHIGTPKTGTTSIQKFLCMNRKILEQNGYCYPDTHDLVPDSSVHMNGRFLVQASTAEEKDVKQQQELKQYRDGMDRVIQLFEIYDNVILSSEHIFRATYSRRSSLWQELKEEGEKHGFTVKIIIFLRRQDLYIASHYNQKVKVNYRGDGHVGVKTWEEYMELPETVEHSLDYYARLEGIRAVLGREAMIVRRFDRKYFYGGTLYSEFLHLIGLEYTEKYQLEKEICNQSLPGNTAEIMRLLNEVEELNDEERLFFRKALYMDGKLSSQYYKAGMFSKEETEKFLEKYKEGNQKIAEEYLRDGEPLFDDTIADLPKYERRNEYMIDDVIRFTALSIKQLREENEKHRKEMKKMKNAMNHPAKTILQKIRS